MKDNVTFRESNPVDSMSGVENEKEVAKYVAKVNAWMCLGLVVTFIMAYYSATSIVMLNFLASNGMGIIFIVQLGIAFSLGLFFKKMSSLMCTVLFAVYSAVTGMTFGALALMFQTASIINAFLATSILFVLLAVIGYVTKKDLTKLGSLMLMGLIAIIISSIINIFLGNAVLDIIICIVGIIIFLSLIAYDTQKIKNLYIAARESGLNNESEEVKKISIYGAFQLYLDFINLFIFILRLFGSRR